MKKYYLVLILLLYIDNIFAQSKNEYGYPIDEKTRKITIENTVSVNEPKSTLYRRIETFIFFQNFDRKENIRCKDKSHIEIQIVARPISFQDPIDGIYLGNGFFNFHYRGKERFVVTFTFKIMAKEKQYTYKITNFRVLEFVTAPKNKGKSRSMDFAGRSSGFVEFSASDVRTFTLEDFITRSDYDNSNPTFIDAIKNFKSQLKSTLQGEL